MTQPLILARALPILACALLSACGITGGTSRFVLPMDLPERPKPASEIRVASAAMDEDAAHLIAVRVHPWGKFVPEDLRNLEHSLRDTLSPHFPATPRSAASRLDVHLVIRRYIVATSNTGGAVLVCVAWAATSPKGRVIYEEQFYAWDEVYLVGTVGVLKDSVHKTIVGRIATLAWTLASNPTGASPGSAPFDNTSTSLEAAASILPHTMVSLGDPNLAGIPGHAAAIVGLITPSGISTVRWEVAKPSGKFDWAGYLKKLYAEP